MTNTDKTQAQKENSKTDTTHAQCESADRTGNVSNKETHRPPPPCWSSLKLGRGIKNCMGKSKKD